MNAEPAKPGEHCARLNTKGTKDSRGKRNGVLSLGLCVLRALCVKAEFLFRVFVFSCSWCLVLAVSLRALRALRSTDRDCDRGLIL